MGAKPNDQNALDTQLEELAIMEERITSSMPWVNYAIHPLPLRDINTREEWLEAACMMMKPWIDGAAIKESEVRTLKDKNGIPVTIEVIVPPKGFDVAVAPIEKASRGCLGICRHATFHNGRARIQLNPKMTGDETKNSWNIPHGNDATYLVHVLLHEMVHAYTEGHGHRGYFSAIMKRLNTAGKMTSSIPGDMQAHLIDTRVLPFLPLYSDLHVPFEIVPRGKRGAGSRLLKMVTGCGLIMRASYMVVEEIMLGEQLCPACDVENLCEISCEDWG